MQKAELRRLLLVATVTAPSVTALIAIVALLAGDFGDTDLRIMGTTAGFGLCALIATSGTALLDLNRYVTLARAVIGLSALAFPQWGLKLLRELGGFSAPVQELVHSHHERLDSKGYPRGLEAGAIGLDTRILTVCDVYDALVSPRVYRGAWSHEAAMGLLREQIGEAFDERCVGALERVLGREEPRRDVPALRVAAASA